MDDALLHDEEFDMETSCLQGLLEAFSSVCSLEEIATAYTTAEGNADIAGGILCQLQNSRPDGFTGKNSSGDIEVCSQSEKSQNGEESFDPADRAGSFDPADRAGRLKPKKMSISTGLVSDVVRKRSSRSSQSPDASFGSIKPSEPKHESSDTINIPEPEDKQSDQTDDAFAADVRTKRQLLSNHDIEEFLFAMLHDGFNLDKEKIQDVLGSCGYDMKKTMDELLEMSSLNPFKSIENSSNYTIQPTAKPAEIKPPNSEDYAVLDSTQRLSQNSLMSVTGSHSLKQQSDVLNEVLEALFKDSKQHEEPKRTQFHNGSNRRNNAGQRVVSSPLDDVNTHQDSNKPLISKGAPSKENSYEVLERAVRQHWDMMRAYYGAAVDAVSKGDHDRANYLRDQGNHYANKIRETEEKYSQEIIRTRSKNEVKLELDIFDAKEAVRILKKHLRLLAGIPSLPLKVIINSDKEDTTKGKRKQRVLKFLERASILWTAEEGQESIIIIEVEHLDTEKLSRARKENEG